MPIGKIEIIFITVPGNKTCLSAKMLTWLNYLAPMDISSWAYSFFYCLMDQIWMSDFTSKFDNQYAVE